MKPSMHIPNYSFLSSFLYLYVYLKSILICYFSLMLNSNPPPFCCSHGGLPNTNTITWVFIYFVGVVWYVKYCHSFIKEQNKASASSICIRGRSLGKHYFVNNEIQIRTYLEQTKMQQPAFHPSSSQ